MPAPADAASHPAAAIHIARGAETPRIRVSTPKKLLSLVPYLLGFHPAGCVVILGANPDGQLAVILRVDLPGPADPQQTTASARLMAAILANGPAVTVGAAGYGPEDRVAPFAAQFRDLAARQDITVTEFLRAENGRYWSYVCTGPACCPPEGTPYELADDPELARALPEGLPGILGSREDLAALVAPVTGTEATAMRQATKRAENRRARLLNREPEPGQPSGPALVTAAGITAGQAALARARDGGDLTPGEAGWLTVALRDLPVRDDLWSRLAPEDRKHNLPLLLRLTRLARSGYIAPAASLLAFTAWQCGNGALANLALDRAQTDNPAYSLAGLIRDAVTGGVPPEQAKPPLTPEEVAAAFAEQAAGKAARLYAQEAERAGHGHDRPRR